ncbi:MAG: Type II secretion system protein [Candidatus Berkelbacteria bacterium Licking1014_7]|uniref:Type II secretion system protein n=1 Tax=Candidatus Berkelbacteria bacterium Licking1014_7 TaxID=2017147 RepID=A0A554LK37_9BACT|nr:MAG: Type II secretion system protein [Candidatus Berkelbacteria bacterium Licking1014_7]
MKKKDFILLKKVSTEEKAFFSKQLAVMIGAGLQLAGAVNILKNQTRNQYFKQVLTKIYDDLEQGKKFSEALANYPNVFNRVYINIVFSGENSGKLDKVLAELGDQLTQENDFTSRLRGAMIYPMIILMALIGVAIFTSVKLIPSLQQMFSEAKSELPWTTKIVFGFSNFLIHSWLWVILIIVAGVVLVMYFLRTAPGEMLLHQILLKEPFGLFKKIYLLRFTRTLGSLLSSGVPIIDALNITSEVVGNDVYREELQFFANELERGAPLSVPVSRSKLFPYFISQMIIVGEKTGQTDKILVNLAENFYKETTYQIDNFAKTFEPVIILIIGMGVALLVFAVIMPIYQFAQFVG